MLIRGVLAKTLLAQGSARCAARLSSGLCPVVRAWAANPVHPKLFTSDLQKRSVKSLADMRTAHLAKVATKIQLLDAAICIHGSPCCLSPGSTFFPEGITAWRTHYFASICAPHGASSMGLYSCFFHTACCCHCSLAARQGTTAHQQTQALPDGHS